jgi:hypothetical protein
MAVRTAAYPSRAHPENNTLYKIEIRQKRRTCGNQTIIWKKTTNSIQAAII